LRAVRLSDNLPLFTSGWYQIASSHVLFQSLGSKSGHIFPFLQRGLELLLYFMINFVGCFVVVLNGLLKIISPQNEGRKVNK
jgi:hypothetical protein